MRLAGIAALVTVVAVGHACSTCRYILESGVLPGVMARQWSQGAKACKNSGIFRKGQVLADVLTED